MSNPSTPKSLGYRWPAEWEPHEATWLSWPHNRDSWPGKFDPVPAKYSRFVLTIAQFEPVHVLASGEALEHATELIGNLPNIHLHDVPTNDCWIRDHGPWFLQHEVLKPALVNWGYNAWGGKYPPFDDDDRVPAKIAEMLGMQQFLPGLIMEGGSVENNGAGVLLVTSQCLLNPNRNAGCSREQIEQALCEYSGADKVLWLFDADDGSIPGDDTDAHIDQLARFVTSDTIVAAANRNRVEGGAGLHVELLDKLHEQLGQMTDLRGQKFQVVPLPMPEPVFYEENQLPASYANFYVGNGFVIYPTFDCPQDQLAGEILQEVHPGREVIGLDAVDLVWGLGAFHCASMQQGHSS